MIIYVMEKKLIKNLLKNIFLLLCLASCGFRPMYKETPYNDLSQKTSEIAIPPVKGFDGQYGIELRNNLLNKLTPKGKPENPIYVLDVTLHEPSISDYTIKTDGVASSKLVRMKADYIFKKKGSADVLLKKTVSTSAPYNLLKNQFSTEMLKKEAVDLSVMDLANQIYFSILIYFAEK